MIAPPSLEPETIPGAEAVSTSQAPGIDKGKGVYIPPPPLPSKKAPAMRPKGIVIGTPTVCTPTPEKEEKVLPEDISHALPAIDVPLASLSEKEQLALALALALKASIDTYERNKQRPWPVLFLTDQPVCWSVISSCSIF